MKQTGMSEKRWKEMLEYLEDAAWTENECIRKGYYYTSVDTLGKILDSGAIYSTNYHYLNDPVESYHGYRELVEQCEKLLDVLYPGKSKKEREFKEFIRDIIQEKSYLNDYPILNDSVFEGNHSELFTLSFTEEEDLISQWERYAKESGVVLELDFAAFDEEAILYQQTAEGKEIPIDVLPRNVLYQECDIRESAKKIVEALYEDYPSTQYIPESRLKRYLQMSFRYMASYIKNSAYEQEKELRISIYPLTKEMQRHGEVSFPGIKYTMHDNVFIPHLPIYCGRKKGNKIELCGWPIRSIRVGPGYNQSVVFQGIIHRLECGKSNIQLLSVQEQKVQKNKFILEGIADFYNMDVEAYLTNEQLLRALIMKLSSKADKKVNLFTKQQNLLKELKKIARKSSSEGLEDVVGRVQLIRRDYYDAIFRKYEEKYFCTSEGILIKCSDIPFLFNK